MSWTLLGCDLVAELPNGCVKEEDAAVDILSFKASRETHDIMHLSNWFVHSNWFVILMKYKLLRR